MQRTHETTLDFGDLGDQPVTVYYDWQPYERQTHLEPGCPEGFDITDVKWNGLSVMDKIIQGALGALVQDMMERKNDDD